MGFSSGWEISEKDTSSFSARDSQGRSFFSFLSFFEKLLGFPALMYAGF